MQSRFVVVDEDGCRDVHGIHQAEAFLDATVADDCLDLWRDVQKVHPGGDVEREVFRL